MAETVYYRFRVRSYTAAEFASSNDILLERELGVETDTKHCKFGDGSTPWNDLEYVAIGLGKVDLSTLSNGSILLYDATNGQWLSKLPTTDDIAEGTRLYYTDERAQDAIAAVIAAGTHIGITFVYDDANNRISATVTGGSSSSDIRDIWLFG